MYSFSCMNTQDSVKYVMQSYNFCICPHPKKTKHIGMHIKKAYRQVLIFFLKYIYEVKIEWEIKGRGEAGKIA